MFASVSRNRDVDVLLVEDSPSDAELTRQSLDKALCRNLFHVEDGEEALAFLRREGAYQEAPRPDLILLDLNLPRRGGLEVLAEIRRDQTLKSIAVAVLTTSQDESDIAAAYELNVNCFISKPVSMPQFLDAMHAFQLFWFGVVSFPRKA